MTKNFMRAVATLLTMVLLAGCDRLPVQEGLETQIIEAGRTLGTAVATVAPGVATDVAEAGGALATVMATVRPEVATEVAQAGRTLATAVATVGPGVATEMAQVQATQRVVLRTRAAEAGRAVAAGLAGAGSEVATSVAPSGTPEAPPSTMTATVTLTETMPVRLTVNLPEFGEIPLENGQFERSYGQRPSEVLRVGIAATAQGDLNRDGNEDLAAIVWWNAGGSGTFVHLAAFVQTDGKLRQAGIDVLGDRVRVNTLEVVDGEIVLGMVIHGPEDPLCCPTLNVLRRYRLQDGGLEILPEQVAG